MPDNHRYMRPATPHIVVTTSSCVAEGSHYYNFNNLDSTFTGMVAEHFYGALITNSELPRAALLLCKGLDALLDLFIESFDDSKKFVDADMAWGCAFSSSLSLNI